MQKKRLNFTGKVLTMNPIKKVYCRVFQTTLRAALPFLPYREPEVFASIAALDPLLNKLGVRSVLLVTDKVLHEAGATAELEKMLAKNGIRCTVYDETNANPTVHNVEAARKLYIENACECLLAFGGGSSMDCAKAVGARIAYPDKSLEQLKGLLRVLKKIPTLVAIPTTAGTGSEVTLAAVITDSEKKHKYTMNSFTLIPHYAVLDPKVTYSLPRQLTATTGMDALTHAVEAFIGRSTSRETRQKALMATKLIFANIEKAYTDGHDHEARANMLKAAYLAGVAFSKSYVGYIHAVAHSLGGQYNIPHGLANSVLMPIILDAYGAAVYQKLHCLGVAAGVASKDDSHEAGAKKFIAAIRALNRRMNIPDKLMGIRKEDIPEMAAHADKEANPLYPVPVLMNAKQLEQFYYKVADWGYEIKFESTEGTEKMDKFDALLANQRKFFRSGATLPVEFRIAMLKKLYRAVKDHETEIADALKADLGKSAYEGFMCEIGLVLSEISFMIRNTRKFASEKTVHTPLAQFASRSYKKPSPYGCTLIMSPWNYPFLLTLDPLADAIAAGNTVIVKPSAYSPATSAVIEKIIAECFPPYYVAVVTGGRKENAALLEKKFDLVFFTGSQTVGREVLRHAAEHLTPAVLELGGKSPCIVDSTAKLELAAKRIVFGKYLNCGQTCVAPDYILCDASVKDQLVDEIKKQVKLQYGETPLDNPNYGRIVNEKHFDRICGLIAPDKTVLGGKSNRDTLQIEPTVMDNVTWDDAVMQEEIFGPVMPILTFVQFDAIYDLLGDQPKPLALYLFSENRQHIRAVTERCSYGGGCINDTIIHLATSEMGFGGVGESGMGAYHGKAGFDAFSHTKSIVDKKTWMDLPMRYQPYKQSFDGLLHLFLR